MPSTPLICCSRGMVTADSTTCAFAPTKLLLTVTCGGARVGYSEIGRVGMQTAPARIISRAQTVAKIGRFMKKSTKSARPVHWLSHSQPDYFSENRFGLGDRLHGRAVDQELDTRDDDLFPGLQAVDNGVLVSHRVAKADRTLLGDGAAVHLSRDINKRLAAYASDRQHRNRRRRSGAPHHPRFDQLSIPELVQRSLNRGLHQDALDRVVHLLRDEIDFRPLNQLA